MKYWLKLVALVLITPLVHADYDEGIDYTRLANAQPTVSPDKIEVRELFWYACPHCYHLEPQLDAWLEDQSDDVQFVRMPAILGPSWELLARAYYTAELLDVEDKIHQPLFDRIHKERKPVRSVAELKTFFVERGVPEDDFERTFQSFAVVTKTNRARQARAMYGITGVPALVVNGKYVVSAQMAGGNQQMLDIVEYLVAKERTEASAAAQTPAAAREASEQRP
jgi:thiol:disulfide interchange protein DsbA